MVLTAFPSKLFFLSLVLLLPSLLRNGRFHQTCLAKKAPFNITTDTYALVAFRDHLVSTPSVNNVLLNYWTFDTNISVANSICHWIGVTCGARHQRVVALDLGDMGLSGTIPRQLGNLSFLESFNISKNKFHGQLPQEMAGLRRLSFINVSFNSLSGNIPSWFGYLPQLKYVFLQNNSFIGPIPPSLSNCSKLEVLNMSSNLLSGAIPQQMGDLHKLKSFQMSRNQLSGGIPSSIFNLSSLEILSLARNRISGRLSEDMCASLSKLIFFSVSSNELEGRIPSSLHLCSRLKILSLAYNNFHGSIPSALGNLTVLQEIYLAGYNMEAQDGLSGSLPPDMCSSLSKLRILSVPMNKLEGQIPSVLQLCSRLEVLSLSYNNFHGYIPSALGNLTMLKEIYLGGNNLEGNIPSEWANLINLKQLWLEYAGLGGSLLPAIFKNMTSLEILNLSHNSLSGSIPNEIGNCTSINWIDIGYNHLIGQVPEHMSRLRKLEFLSLQVNNLGGHVPANLFNITSLRVISLLENHFMGDVPSTIGFGLPNLEELYLDRNRFSGTIPVSISNSSRITRMDLGYNNFSGSPPSTLGNLRRLNALTIGENNLRLNGKEFIASLDSCRHLRYLYISSSEVNGPLPSSFGNLTSSLRSFQAYDCGITETIPDDIGNMSNLQTLDLSSNQLVGTLPHTLQGLSILDRLYLSNNNLGGSFPDDMCHLPRLGLLDLHRNKFSGPLPDCLGDIATLRYLYLHHNDFSSKIPASLWTLKDILKLDLSSNSFTGYLHPDIGTLRAVIYIDLSINQLSGAVPSALGSLQTLAYLYLAHNSFEGSIPGSFGKLFAMEELDLSYNNISGEIPKSLVALSQLKILNLSLNQLCGEIPSGGPFMNLSHLSFESNKALCGSPRFHVPLCKSDGSSKHLAKRRKVLSFVYVLTGITMLTLVVLVILYVILKCRRKHHIPSVGDLQPAVGHEQISYYDLQRATNSFDDSNLLGQGSFGSVYKGVFADGRIWAVKVFKLQVERTIRSFDTECELLRNIRHRNLTKVITSCTNLDFMALVLEYMPNGSLEKWLYSHNYLLNVQQRLDIMTDVASAVEYLHHNYSVPVVHCDIKPSNVLLDEDMVAHVSDFGISKFLKEEGSTVQTNTLATIGYTAPEHGREGIVSTRCDVYSFGIMLMEVFTRKRPTEEMFGGDLDLKHWVKQSLPDRVIEVIDRNLVRQDEDQAGVILQCVSDILQLALICSTDSPDERMNIRDVLALLKKIKLRLLASRT